MLDTGWVLACWSNSATVLVDAEEGEDAEAERVLGEGLGSPPKTEAKGAARRGFASGSDPSDAIPESPHPQALHIRPLRTRLRAALLWYHLFRMIHVPPHRLLFSSPTHTAVPMDVPALGCSYVCEPFTEAHCFRNFYSECVLDD